VTECALATDCRKLTVFALGVVYEAKG